MNELRGVWLLSLFVWLGAATQAAAERDEAEGGRRGRGGPEARGAAREDQLALDE